MAGKKPGNNRLTSEKRMHFSEKTARFGGILTIEAPHVGMGFTSIFGNPAAGSGQGAKGASRQKSLTLASWDVRVCEKGRVVRKEWSVGWETEGIK